MCQEVLKEIRGLRKELKADSFLCYNPLEILNS